VRGASAWALGNYDDSAAIDELAKRRTLETDAVVRDEIDAALARRR
jgi:hypothetical protein